MLARSLPRARASVEYLGFLIAGCQILYFLGSLVRVCRKQHLYRDLRLVPNHQEGPHSIGRVALFTYVTHTVLTMAGQQQTLQALTEEYQKLEQGKSTTQVYFLIYQVLIGLRTSAKRTVAAEARIAATGE